MIRPGCYRVIIAEPCDSFCLKTSQGLAYHVRKMPPGENSFDVNIHHADKYTGTAPFSMSYKGPIKPGTLIDLEAPERMRLRPVTVVKNEALQGTPARIFTTRNPAVIEVGPKFYTLPAQMRYFILLHEYGHLFYKTEWKVDRYALFVFIRQGYNPSQAWHALHDVLGRSPEAIDRMKKLFDTLKSNGLVK